MIDYSLIDSKCDLCQNYETRYINGRPFVSRCIKGLRIDKKITEHCEGFERRE